MSNQGPIYAVLNTLVSVVMLPPTLFYFYTEVIYKAEKIGCVAAVLGLRVNLPAAVCMPRTHPDSLHTRLPNINAGTAVCAR